MSLSDYESYLDVVKSSYIRSGVVTDESAMSVGYLDSISILVDITSEESEQKVFDLRKKSNNYLEDLRSKFFEEYLEYKKVSESIAIPEWLAQRVNKAMDTFSDVTLSYGERVKIEKGYRKPAVGVMEPAKNLETSESKGTAKESVGVRVTSVKTYGIDDDGYDIWVLPSLSAQFDSEEFQKVSEVSKPVETVPPKYTGDDEVPERSYEELLQLVTPPSSDSSPVIEEDFSTVETPYKPEVSSDDTTLDDVFGSNELGVLYSEPLYVDEDGYDVWGDSGLGTVAEELPDSTFAGQVYGTDSDGYDIWVKQDSTEYLTVNQAVEDLVEETDYSSSSFAGSVTGVDEDGYDIWESTGSSSEEGTKVEAQGTAEQGDFTGTVTGVDEDGYDIWGTSSDEANHSSDSTSSNPFATQSEDDVDDNSASNALFSLMNGGNGTTEGAPVVDNPFASGLSTDNFIVEEKNPFLESSFGEPSAGNIEGGSLPSSVLGSNTNKGTASGKPYDEKSELLKDLKALDRTTDLMRNTFSRFKL